jgi:lipopolysaccharide biosynthesis glycosyltransferase
MVKKKTALVFSIDDDFLLPFKVLFNSLENTNSIPGETQIFILHGEELETKSITDLNIYFQSFKREAIFLNPTHLLPSNLPYRASDHVSLATYYRLFISEILPAEIDYVVYLDSDMLALRSISNLFTDYTCDWIAAVDHCSPQDGIRIWGDRGGSYFQAGVLVIPLATWRREKIIDRFLEVIQNHNDEIKWWDQDVLNIVFRDCWQRIPIWYNVTSSIHGIYNYSQIEKFAILIHYSGDRKPWNFFTPSPYTTLWDNGYLAAFGVTFDRAALKTPLFGIFKVIFKTQLKRLIVKIKYWTTFL